MMWKRMIGCMLLLGEKIRKIRGVKSKIIYSIRGKRSGGGGKRQTTFRIFIYRREMMSQFSEK